MNRRGTSKRSSVVAVPDTSEPSQPSDSPSPRKSAKKTPPDFVGEVLNDSEGRAWHIDSVLRQGHKAPIYAVSSPKARGENVLKIEPFESGHLFNEFHFYTRKGKKKTIDKWLKHHNLPDIGIPVLVGSGKHSRGDTKYRFLVLPRLGPDLQSLVEGSQVMMCMKVVFWLGIRLLDCLEYLHEHDYTHGDIQASNILLGYSEGHIENNRIFLVDYGISYRYRVDGRQKNPYQENPKLTPEGSITYMSRDAHKGVAQSRRGDLEVLGYCLLRWLCGRLPWEDKLTDKNYVRTEKIRHMDDITSFVSACFASDSADSQEAADTIIAYLSHVKNLGYEEQPGYDILRQSFRDCLLRLGVETDWVPELLSKEDTVPKNFEGAKASKMKAPAKELIKGKHSSSKVVLEKKEDKESAKVENFALVRRQSRSMKSEESPLTLVSSRGRTKNKPQPLASKTSEPIPEQDDATEKQDKSYQIQKSLLKVPPVKPTAAKSPVKYKTEDQKKIKLNIGGKEFVTFQSTLQKYPSKLKDMAEGHSSEDELFFDRDYTYFIYILNFLRDQETTLPDNYLDLRRLREESLYYGLAALAVRIDQELESE